IWHVVLGFDTDIAGELGVQAFYAAQIGGALSPWLIAGGLLQALMREPDDYDRRLGAIARGWALGKRAVPLFGITWDDAWHKSLAEVQRALGISVGNDPGPPPLAAA